MKRSFITLYALAATALTAVTPALPTTAFYFQYGDVRFRTD